MSVYRFSNTFKSIVLSTIDRYGLLLGVLTVSAFKDGVGGESEFHRAVNAINQDTADAIQLEIVTIGEWTTQGGIKLADGTFLTPIADYLPNEAQTLIANIEIVIPSAYTFDEFIAQGRRYQLFFSIIFIFPFVR